MDTKGSAFDDNIMHFRWFEEDEVKASEAYPRRRKDDILLLSFINNDDDDKDDDLFIDGVVKAVTNLCPPL
jgi:hypothetical protein